MPSCAYFQVRTTPAASPAGTVSARPVAKPRVVSPWIEIFHTEFGKAVEGWLETDICKLLDQIS